MSSSCRESPKILGIANAFAGGVFLAIAFMHILPEQAEVWADHTIDKKGEGAKIFPLAELVTFLGYTLILILDKVLFDTAALFENDEQGHGNDPAAEKLTKNVKESMTKHDEVSSAAELRASQVESKKGIEKSMKEYLNPNERFATRMKASLKGSIHEG